MVEIQSHWDRKWQPELKRSNSYPEWISTQKIVPVVANFLEMKKVEQHQTKLHYRFEQMFEEVCTASKPIFVEPESHQMKKETIYFMTSRHVAINNQSPRRQFS